MNIQRQIMEEQSKVQQGQQGLPLKQNTNAIQIQIQINTLFYIIYTMHSVAPKT